MWRAMSPTRATRKVYLDYTGANVIYVLEYWVYLTDVSSEVHNTSAWSDNARVIFDMGNLLFEAQLKEIDEFHTVMNDLEMTFHNQACQT
mgnify:CR=1 FL=1